MNENEILSLKLRVLNFLERCFLISFRDKAQNEEKMTQMTQRPRIKYEKRFLCSNLKKEPKHSQINIFITDENVFELWVTKEPKRKKLK